MVLPAEADDDVARIVQQLAENDNRAAITESERAQSYEQLAALGLSAAQIARRTHRPKAEVDTAATVTASKLATQAAQRYDFLTLDDAALVAEFQDDKDTVTALVTAAKAGRNPEHVAQQARRAKAEAEARQNLIDALAHEGVSVIERPGSQYDSQTGREVRPEATALTELRASKDTTGPVSAQDHAGCPGHAAYVARNYAYGADDFQAVYVCTHPKQHGHRRITATSNAPMSDAERAERKRVIANNKAWEAATPVRGKWITEHVGTGKTAPKGAERFLATAIAHGDRATVNYGQRPTDALTRKIAKAGPGTALRTACHTLLAAWHDGTTGPAGRNTWRNPTDRDRRCMAALIAWGYPAEDVERLLTTTRKK